MKIIISKYEIASLFDLGGNIEDIDVEIEKEEDLSNFIKTLNRRGRPKAKKRGRPKGSKNKS